MDGAASAQTTKFYNPFAGYCRLSVSLASMSARGKRAPDDDFIDDEGDEPPKKKKEPKGRPAAAAGDDVIVCEVIIIINKMILFSKLIPQ